MKKYVFFLLFCLPLLIAIKSLGSVDPKIQWETFTSPHFEIIYDARQYQTARNYALRLELNYKLLSSYFSESPKKTIVVLNDNTDLANGYATSIPYPHIMVYPVLPTSHDSISEYSDWPQELTLHEYTHILNFEPAHGFFKILRYAMGSIITPTMLLPRWWHEGIAVEMETRYSSHGRLRSLYQDATLRALAKDEKFNIYSVADINETDLDSWPRGSRPYLFGSILLSEILNQENSKGNNIGENLLQNYSSRIPYLINGPVNDQLGKDFQTLFAQTIEETKVKLQAQLNKIHEAPTSIHTIMAPDLLESHSPQISPNGRFLTFVGKNKWGKSLIQIYDRHEEGRAFDFRKDILSDFVSLDKTNGNINKDAPPVGNINRIAWYPDSSGFIFDQVKNIDAYSNYSDLFSYDLNTKKHKRLTTGLRLREPHISSSGQWIAAIQLEQSNSKLVILKIDGSQLIELYTPDPFVKLAYPLFVNEETLLFTERDIRGIINLKKINLPTKKVEIINIQNITQIESLNQESSGISFVAQENGLQNLYLTPDLFKTVQKLTQTDTAIFDGSIDQRLNLIYSTVMTSSGIQVTSSDLISNTLKNPNRAISPLLSSRYDNSKIQSPTTDALETEFGGSLGPKETYSSFNYLRPRYWLPFAYVTSSGYGTQISTTTFDPLEKQTYSLQAGYDSFTRQASVGLNYLNTMTYWPVSLSAMNYHRNQLYLNTKYDAKLLDILLSHDLRPLSENSTFWIGLNSSAITTNNTRKRFGPKLMFIYDGTSKSTFSEIPFSGLQFTLTANHSIKTEKNSYTLSGIASATYYYSHYLPERHIALLHVMAQHMKGELLTSDLSQSSNYYLTQNFSSPQFVLRGYEQGYFYLKSAKSATLEYHFPLTSYKGFGTLPIFSKKMHLNIFAEALALDGYSLSYSTEKYLHTSMNNYFTSYGVELKDDLTFGFYYPMTFLLGLYQRPQYSGTDKSTLFLGFQI